MIPPLSQFQHLTAILNEGIVNRNNGNAVIRSEINMQLQFCWFEVLCKHKKYTSKQKVQNKK